LCAFGSSQIFAPDFEIVIPRTHFAGTAARVPVLATDTAGMKRRPDMKAIFKYASIVALTGAVALAAATPSEARHGRNAAAIGFGVGAVAGAAIASSAYNNGYYADQGYAYAPGYAYESGPVYESYGYEPAPTYGYYDNWSRQHNTNNFSIDSQR
jgi:hypothetical protein